MPIRILHTADWQIGKQFARITGDAGATVRQQRFETIRTIAKLATEREVDAVLVAGDVFDSNAVSDETLRRTINAMAGFSGSWVLLPGNHDAAQAQSAWTRLRNLGIVPDNVVLATEPEPIKIASGAAFVLPAPLQRRHEISDLTDYFDAAETPQNAFRIGLAHGSVNNRLPEAADAMNPISDNRAETARLDYLALGDWHGTLNIAPRTWYAGTPEQDRFKGNDPGNVLLGEFDQPGTDPVVERVRVGRFAWQQIEFDVDGADSIDALDYRLNTFAKPADQIIDLRIKGMIDLEGRRRLEDVLAAAAARFHHFEFDDTALKAVPSEDDIARMQASGFLAETVARLSKIQDDANDPQQHHAAQALRILYLEQLSVRGQQ